VKHLKTNVCIVGSGVAGSLCAKYLARDSGQILIVERGAAVTHSWRMQTRKQEMSVPTARHHHVMMGPNKNFDIQYVHALGGTTNYWMGQAPRLAPNDFKMKSRYGILEDWPVSYEELEPYYCLAEDELSIAGASDNPLIPRSKPYPLPPHPFSPVDLLMRECFPENAVVSTPQARPTKPVGVRPACCATTTCQLCPVDSKYTTLNTHIPQLEMLSNVKILTDTVVVKLETDGNRRIRRILAKQDLGTDVSIEADVFILAANALENAALLLRSESIPNLPSVGKFLFDHPVFKVVLRTSKEGWANYGNSKWTAHCYQFYDGVFRGDRSGALGEIWNESSLELADLFVSTVLEKRLYGGSLRK